MGKLEYSKVAAEQEKTGYGRAPLPKGEYDAIVTSASYRKSKANNNDQYSISFAITAGKLKGRTFWHNMTYAGESNANIFFSQMAGLGLDAAYFAEIEDGETASDIICADLIDAEFHVTAGEPREWNGQPQTRITSIKAFDGGSSAGRRVSADDDGLDDDEPVAKPKRARRAAAADPDDDTPAPAKRARRPLPPVPPEEEDDDEEDYPDDEDEEAPVASAPTARRRGRPSLPPGVSGSKDI